MTHDGLWKPEKSHGDKNCLKFRIKNRLICQYDELMVIIEFIIKYNLKASDSSFS